MSCCITFACKGQAKPMLAWRWWCSHASISSTILAHGIFHMTKSVFYCNCLFPKALNLRDPNEFSIQVSMLYLSSFSSIPKFQLVINVKNALMLCWGLNTWAVDSDKSSNSHRFCCPLIWFVEHLRMFYQRSI